MKPEDIERVKDLLPTSLGSAEIRERIAREILQRSVFVSRIENMRFLAKVRETAAALSSGEINAAKAKEQLLGVLSQIGYDTTADDGKLSNIVSERRLNLILETQREMAASAALIASQNAGTIDQFPGWNLTRLAGRRVPREDWPARWNAAGNSVGWEGAYQHVYNGDGADFGFVALKDSPIWQALGDGAGGFTDTLGNPYPPFAFSSGKSWLQVDRATCERLGLIEPGASAGIPDAPSLSPAEKDIADAAKRYGFDESYFDDILNDD